MSVLVMCVYYVSLTNFQFLSMCFTSQQNFLCTLAPRDCLLCCCTLLECQWNGAGMPLDRCSIFAGTALESSLNATGTALLQEFYWNVTGTLLE
jgi:hypothetical protein